MSMVSSDPYQTKKKDNEKKNPAANGLKKDDSEELVIAPLPIVKHANSQSQSEEDQNLKSELETLVERLKVCYTGLVSGF